MDYVSVSCPQSPCWRVLGRPVLAGALAIGLLVCPAAADSARMPLMMPDDFSELLAVAWRVEPALPDTHNPLLEGEMPWDRGGVLTHGTVLKDPIDGLFKAWIICTPAEEGLPGPGTTIDRFYRNWLKASPEERARKGLGNMSPPNHWLRRLCYFESRDGVNWTRPRPPNSAFGKYEATNILLDETANGGTQCVSVSVDPGNKEWPYEMFVYRKMYWPPPGPKNPKLCHLHSKDGKVWEQDYGPISGPFRVDHCFVYPMKELDPGKGAGYVAYYKLTGMKDDQAHIPCNEVVTRQLFRAESTDGKKWTDGQVTIRRDERDHRDTQYMELVPHRVPGGYVGVVSVYHPIIQTQDFSLAVSRDGLAWWFPDRRPCLANPPLGDYGGGMLWASKNLVPDGDQLYIYYGAMEGVHKPLMDTRGTTFQKDGLDTVLSGSYGFMPFNSALCRAAWRVDRLYGLAAAAGGPTIGAAVATPQDLAGKQLRVNFRTRPAKKASIPGLDEGYLLVELLDEQGKAVPGFTRADCQMLRGDHRSLTIQWKGGQVAPKEARKAKFYLKRAFLYGFEFSS